MATDYIEGLKKQFWQTRREKRALDAKRDTLAAKRDAIQDAADAEIAPLNVEIKALIAEQVGVQERENFLAKGLGAKVGEDPDALAALA